MSRFALATLLLCALSARVNAGLLIAVGDSTTAKREVSPGVWLKTYSHHLSDAYPGQVANAGVGGDRTTHVLARLQTDVLDRDPDMVVLQIGVNDAFLKADGTPRVPLVDFEANMREILSRMSGVPEVLVLTPAPLSALPPGQAQYVGLPDINATNKQYAASLATIAAEYSRPLIDVAQSYYDFWSGGGHKFGMHLDYVHPNNAGHAMTAGMITGLIITQQLVVPEPAGWLLLGLGCVGLLATKRRPRARR